MHEFALVSHGHRVSSSRRGKDSAVKKRWARSVLGFDLMGLNGDNPAEKPLRRREVISTSGGLREQQASAMGRQLELGLRV
jgi:hypothetical protein